MKLEVDIQSKHRKTGWLNLVIWLVAGILFVWICISALFMSRRGDILSPVWDLRLYSETQMWLLGNGRIAYNKDKEDAYTSDYIRIAEMNDKGIEKFTITDSAIVNLVVDNQKNIYIITEDNKLIAFDNKLNELWRYELNTSNTSDVESSIFSTIGLGKDGLVYCVTSTGYVVSVSDKGQMVRCFQAIPGIDPNADSKGRLLYVDKEDISGTAFLVVSVWDGPNETSRMNLSINTAELTWLSPEQKFVYIHGSNIECISEEGLKLWKYNLSSKKAQIIPNDKRWIKVFDDTIILIQDNELIAIDSNGRLKWQKTFADENQTAYSVVKEEEGIIVQCENENTLGIDLLTGKDAKYHKVIFIDASGDVKKKYSMLRHFKVITGFDEDGACYAIWSMPCRQHYRLTKLEPE